MSTSYKSYIVQSISIYLVRILQPLEFGFVLLDLILLNILGRTMAYAASVGNNLDFLWLKL
jgi:hypothetical protein